MSIMFALKPRLILLFFSSSYKWRYILIPPTEIIISGNIYWAMIRGLRTGCYTEFEQFITFLSKYSYTFIHNIITYTTNFVVSAFTVPVDVNLKPRRATTLGKSSVLLSTLWKYAGGKLPLVLKAPCIETLVKQAQLSHLPYVFPRGLSTLWE